MKLVFNYLLVFSTLLMMASCRDFKSRADLIIYNTTIYTVDSSETVAASIAIREGKILAVGTDAEVRSRYWSENNINAKGMFVYPGFIDAHSHFSGYAEYLRYADLTSAGSYEEVLSIIREYHKRYPESWIVGRGWDQNKWPGRQFPESGRLDKLYPETPVVLTRIDGHAVLANRAALIKAGLNNIPQSEAIRRNGQPIGVYLEGTADILKAAIPKPSPDEMAQLLADAATLCQAAGLTGVCDAGIDKDMILLLDTLQKQGKLAIRIDAMLNPTEDNLNYFFPGGVYETSFLRVGSIKIYADGALGSRGACLLKPYSDDPDNWGILVTPASEMLELCNKAEDAGFQVCTHAIGDSAVRTVLKVYGEALEGKNDRRWRIEHAQVVNEDDFELFAKYSVIPSIQATHATSDMEWAGLRLGKTRLKNAYAYHRLLEQNGWIANGTDFPIEKINPLLTFYASVARKDLNGNPKQGFQKENALSRKEALKSITAWAAKASFLEDQRGSLAVGNYADIVILDRDILTIPEDQIPSTSIRYTICDGKIVYRTRR